MIFRAFVVSLVVGSAGAAFGQAQVVPSDADKAAEKTDVEGWAPYLSLNSSFALASNSDVVGQVNGISTLFGLGVTGGADYVHGPHLLRTSLAINEGFARTPAVDRWVKTSDAVKLEGLYNHFETPNLGEFARLSLGTSLFVTNDVRGMPSTWVETVPNGTPITLTSNGLEQRLSDAFKPFTISESVGGFADPIKKDKLALSVRLGVGGRHTFANGVLALDDDKTTPEIELVELQDVQQLGVEAFAGATGKLDDNKANYKAGLSVLLPLVDNDKYNRSSTELTRIAFEGQLTFNVYSWMGLVYNVSIIRDPELFPAGSDKVQVQNTLLLTFQLSLIKKPEKPKEPTKEELELKAAVDRANAAEKRAEAAEKKLQLLMPAPPTTVPSPPPTEPAPTPPPPGTTPTPAPPTP
ncbi:MAG TPA: hypothetical protein VLX92_03470 [Kofleriaceae bacterium]|nr:hypothetical protein [Kofleriaceae bacterium]